MPQLREDVLNLVAFAFLPSLCIAIRLMNCIAPSMRVPENTACAVGVETPAKCHSVACILASMSEKAGNKATKRKMIGIRFLSCNLADVCLYENL
jgi:hypothetical protein